MSIFVSAAKRGSKAARVDMKSSSSRSAPKAHISSGTFVIESSRAPGELAARSSASYTVATHSENYRDRPGESSTNHEFDSSTFTRSRAKLRVKKPVPPDVANLQRTVVKSEQRNSVDRNSSIHPEVDLSAGPADNVSETGTYTIEGDDDKDKEVDSARESIDSVFGVVGPDGYRLPERNISTSSIDDDQVSNLNVNTDNIWHAGRGVKFFLVNVNVNVDVYSLMSL